MSSLGERGSPSPKRTDDVDLQVSRLKLLFNLVFVPGRRPEFVYNTVHGPRVQDYFDTAGPFAAVPVEMPWLYEA